MILKKSLQNGDVMSAWERVFSDQEVLEWIERTLERYQQFGYGHYIAIKKQTQKVIGQIGIIPECIEGQASMGIGWILDKTFWGKGYATEGGRATLKYAFEVLKVPEIIADIRPTNSASICVAERIGMKKQGQYDKIVYGKKMPHDIYFISHSVTQLV